MAGYGLATLSGLLGGLSGLPTGMVAGEKLDQSQQHIDLLKQQLAQQQAQQFSPVPASMLSPDMAGRADPSGNVTVPTHLVQPYLAEKQRQITRDEAVKKSAALSLAIGPLAANNPSFKALQDALTSGADATAVAPIFESMRQHELSQQQREQGMRMVAPLYKALGIEMPTPQTPQGALPASAAPPDIADAQRGVAATEQNVNQKLNTYNATPGEVRGTITPIGSGGAGGGPTPMPAAAGPAPMGGYQKPILTFDPMKGTFSVAAHPTPPEQPGTELVAAMKAKQALQAAGVPETDPRYKPINDRLDLYKAWVLPPGGAELKGAGTGMDRPGPGAAGPPVPGRALATTPPPVAAPTETGPAADALSWIKEARQRADQLDEMLGKLTAAQRVRLEGRLNLQSKPLIGALPLTSKAEQEISSAVGKLGIDWERASGGLRMAASPQMQDRVRSILGSPANAATAQHLRTIAGMMEQELQQRAATEAQGGRRPLSAPPGGAQPAPLAAPAPGLPQPGPGETVSRRSAGYQKARQSGLSDQQIQQQFGVTLTD